jgi:hypothetical protein
MSSKIDRVPTRKSKKSALEWKKLLPSRLSQNTRTSRSGFWYGSGRNRTALVTLKIAVLAPILRASVITAVVENIGLFRRVRHAYMKSPIKVLILRE